MACDKPAPTFTCTAIARSVSATMAAGESSQVLTNVPCCVGVANLMLDILAQLGSGDDLGSQHSGPSSLLLLGPPGVGESMLHCISC